MTISRYHFAYLTHQHLFKVTESEWEQLFDQQWFPFITLKNATTRQLLKHVRRQFNLDDLLDMIAEEVLVSLDRMLDRWRRSELFEGHFELINHAVNCYRQGDHMSATSIIYPRIEGIMRTLHIYLGRRKRASQKNLVASVTEARDGEFHGHSLLLPQMFRKYLQDVYFADFSPDEPAKLSRHSVAHGVANPQDYSLKAATIGLLILDQIYFYLPTKSEKSS